MAEQFFSVEKGLGLSLLRVQIRSDGMTSELGTVDAAVSYGVKVWATPWTPPSDLKTSGTNNDGSLIAANYDVWAKTLADFAASMQERGTPLIGLSAQNEPDFDADWDACTYSAQELATFTADHLAPALAARAPDVKIIAPETADWESLEEYADAILDQPSLADRLLAIATHDYGGAPFELTRAAEAGQELWMTETSDNNKNADTGMKSAITIASKIHAALTRANASAWHHWWLLPRTDQGIPDTNAGLTDPKLNLTKRAYALGQFSRFIRPDYVRVESNNQLALQVLGSAYQNSDHSQLVLVFVSDRSDAISQIVSVPGEHFVSTQLWVTDAKHSLERANDDPEITSRGEQLKFDLPPNSVVTVVAQRDTAMAAPSASD